MAKLISKWVNKEVSSGVITIDLIITDLDNGISPYKVSKTFTVAEATEQFLTDESEKEMNYVLAHFQELVDAASIQRNWLESLTEDQKNVIYLEWVQRSTSDEERLKILTDYFNNLN